MKFISPLRAGLVFLSLLIAASAQDAFKFEVPGVTTPAKPAQPAPAAPKANPPAAKASAPAAPAAAPASTGGKKTYTEAQLAEAYGWFLGAQMGLRQLEFTKEQVEALGRGLVGVASGAQPPFDAREIGPEVEAFLERKNQTLLGKVRAVQAAASNEHFAKLKENKNVVTLPSGLAYEVLQAGKGATPKPGQVVSFHYTGALATGQVFDSSIERGEPAEVLLQQVSQQTPNGVIPGMFEGLQKGAVGSKLRLHIPAALAYGDGGVPGIPPGAALIFEVEILGVKDAPAAK